MNIIIYGTQYGTAGKYAETLADRTNTSCMSYEDVEDINRYDIVVYIGALYAGGVQGMKKTLSKYKADEHKKLIIATVGLADPEDQENTDHIKNSMKNQLPAQVYDSASIYHLRGGIDYSKLNLKHKTMMGLLYRKAKALPEEKKNAEVQAMIDTYNKVVDFVDYECLNPIAGELENL